MGILRKLFGNNESETSKPKCEPMSVYAPVVGTVISLSAYPDDVFSQGTMGKGCGILPSEELVTAPFNGTIVATSDTLHAVGIQSDDGVEVLIHVGVDTVCMNGKGFKYHVKEGQRVCLGDPLIEFDRETIKNAGYSDAVAVLVTNSFDYADVELKMEGTVTNSDIILKIR